MSSQTNTAQRTLPQTSKERPHLSMIELFYHWEATQPNKVYLRQPNGDDWTEYTWKEVGEQARKIAKHLKAMDFPPQSRIALISKNCAHWIMADLAIMMAGYVSVPLYPNLDEQKLSYILEHSESKAIIVGKLDVWEDKKNGIPDNIKVIRSPDYPASVKVDKGEKWEDILAKTEPLEENIVPNYKDMWTISYTSGTTGSPKGVVISYKTSAYGIGLLKDEIKLVRAGNRFFSYLPLCHVAERNIVESASLVGGGIISFAESLDTFAKNLEEARPTHFLAVPRIWTKFQLGILKNMPQKKLNFLLSIPILSGFIKKKIRKKLGLNDALYLITAAAPMPQSLLTWYRRNLDLYIQEAYGMTENLGVCTYMRKYNIKSGTVGQPYPHTEVKIDPKNGEILMKAPWLMDGYYKDKKKTDETIKDGWLHTGDMGELDEENFLKITGRIKDQFKTSKGEFVVPGPMEKEFAANTNVEQVCVLGRGLAQPVALIILSEMGQNADKDEVEKSLEKTMAEVNSKCDKHEVLHNVIVCEEPWTPENQILTPTLKIKRNVLENKFEQKMQEWYKKKDKIVWE